MGISRRTFLALTASLPVAAGADPIGAHDAPAPCLISAAGDGRGGYRIAAAGADGRASFCEPLPSRGHGTAVHPSGREIIFIARRPGDSLLVLDASTGARIAERRTPPERHLCGHGVYSDDGTRLYTTENALPSGDGRIGVCDASARYTRVGDPPAQGIGPHELLMAPDGERLIVAIGGIRTLPETGRAKLNLNDMRPALVYLDRHSGALCEEQPTRRLPAPVQHPPPGLGPRRRGLRRDAVPGPGRRSATPWSRSNAPAADWKPWTRRQRYSPRCATTAAAWRQT